MKNNKLVLIKDTLYVTFSCDYLLYNSCDRIVINDIKSLSQNQKDMVKKIHILLNHSFYNICTCDYYDFSSTISIILSNFDNVKHIYLHVSKNNYRFYNYVYVPEDSIGFENKPLLDMVNEYNIKIINHGTDRYNFSIYDGYTFYIYSIRDTRVVCDTICPNHTNGIDAIIEYFANGNIMKNTLRSLIRVNKLFGDNFSNIIDKEYITKILLNSNDKCIKNIDKDVIKDGFYVDINNIEYLYKITPLSVVEMSKILIERAKKNVRSFKM